MLKSSSFSLKLHYGLHCPILFLNGAVVVAEIWLQMHPAARSSTVWPWAAVIPTAVVLLYTIALLSISLFRVVIPHQARILGDSLVLIPCYIAAIILLGIGTTGQSLGHSAQCLTLSTSRCRDRSIIDAIIQVVAMALALIAMILTIIELAVSVHLRRRERRTKSDVMSII
ncbi:hypothetical protein C8J56DRAFT_1131052 [Mycena floridula]|nr:hypothetical protein C8J56DRAFT_1131052 [Mycena floridula]